MDLKNILRSTLTVFTLSLIIGLSGYLVRVILARNLSVAEFGLFYSVMSLFMFMVYLLDTGMSASVINKIVELRIKNKKILNNFIMTFCSIQTSISILLFILLNLFANSLSINYFKGDAVGIIFFLSLWLLTIPVYNSYIYIVSGHKKPELGITFDVFKSILIVLLTIIFLKMNFELISPAISYFLANIFILIIGYFVVKKIFPSFNLMNFKFEKKESLVSLKYGFFIGVSNLIWLIILQIDTLLLTYFKDSISVGLYQIAINTSNLLLYLPNALYFIILPMVSEFYFRNRLGKLRRELGKIYLFMILAILPMILLMISFSEVIIGILFTSKYVGASTALKILALSTLFSAITTVNNTVLIAIGQSKKIFKFMILIAVLNIILNLALIPKYGIIGSSISVLITFIAGSIISSLVVYSNLPIKYPLLKTILGICLSCAIYLFINYFRHVLVLNNPFLETIILVGVVILLYISGLFLFRIISVKDLNIIKNYTFF